tara:strand:+ start:952 stop:1689 length:738 start_codon:yes stop_codon:yes gene_type:complete
MEKILSQLKNDKEYYSGVGQNYLSNSDISDLLHNPKNFKKPKADNKNFLFGRYFHQLILEPEKSLNWEFVEASSRNTKLYKEAIINAADDVDVMLLEKERLEAKELKELMVRNFDFAMSIYKTGNLFEEPAIKKIKGVMWKGKADIVSEDCVIDIKTTSDISRFKWSARTYNYDSQAYLYQQLFNKPLVFFVICKESRVLGKFSPTQEFLERGEQKVIRAVEMYNMYIGDKNTARLENFYLNEEL